jgi:mannose-6-phosphate isomerase-like protein (cupin superfamily)
MDDLENIEPGIIESYCLGLLSRQECEVIESQALVNTSLKQRIDDFMLSVERFAMVNAIDPGVEVKMKTLRLLENLRLEEERNIHKLPLLNRYSDYKNWLQIVKPLLPEKLNQPILTHQLRNDSEISQMVIWTAVDIPNEVHEDVEESFIVLEGSCRCFIEGKVVQLEPGDFLEIPLHSHHNVEALGDVLAVLQRVKVA